MNNMFFHAPILLLKLSHCVGLCVCVYVCERERGREKERDSERQLGLISDVGRNVLFTIHPGSGVPLFSVQWGTC